MFLTLQFNEVKCDIDINRQTFVEELNNVTTDSMYIKIKHMASLRVEFIEKI